MKQRAAVHDVAILWQIIRMAASLHIVTIVFTLSKGAGVLSVTWLVVFLPSLLYGALIVLIVSSWTLLRWADVSIHRGVADIGNITPASSLSGYHQRDI